MFEPLYTAEEMRAAEAGHDVATLMERAGRAVAEHVLERYPDARRIAAVCGGGANGGDGRVAVRVLREAGRDAEETTDVVSADVIVDALFGTGFRGAPRPEAAALIAAINATGAPVVAVDVPSGVDASTGEVLGPAVRATSTVSFHGRKVGLAVGPGAYYAGDVRLVDIGLAAGPTRHVALTTEVLRLVPRKRAEDNKYRAGAVVVVGGSPGMTGAAALAARAALRADAGYVALVAHRDALPVLETLVVEAVKRPLEDAVEVAQRADALVLGPGLGRKPEAKALVRQLLADVDKPVVVDADALFELGPIEREAATILTPHAGELSRLLGVEAAWVDAHRLEAVRRAVDRFGTLVLLKGRDTIVAGAESGVVVSTLGPPTLATAGTGDVLAGIIGAFLAKGMESREAAAAALAAQAAAAAATGMKAGLVAGDVVEALPRALAA